MKKKIMILVLALSLLLSCACFDLKGADDSALDSVQVSASDVSGEFSKEESSDFSSETPVASEENSASNDDVVSEENSIFDESSEDDSQTEYCLVQFDTDGAGDVETVRVEQGEKLAEPTPPQKTSKECEYEFLGWFYGEKQWDFATDVVTEDMTLVAHWKEENKYTNPFLPKD